MAELKIGGSPSIPSRREIDTRTNGTVPNVTHAPTLAEKSVIIAMNIVRGSGAEALRSPPPGAETEGTRFHIALPSNFNDVNADLVTHEGREYVRTSGQFGDVQWYRAEDLLKAP